MARASVQFICRSCGAVHPRWMGKCPDCGEWDALEEHRLAAGAAGGGRGARAAAGLVEQAPQARPLGEVGEQADHLQRLSTGIKELDRVLGGAAVDNAGSPAAGEQASRTRPLAGSQGLVPGSAVLIGGDPGIGKSTLMLQTAHALSAQGRRVLYVTSEESVQQLRLRARRLNHAPSDADAQPPANPNPPEELFVLADTNLARIVEQVRRTQPAVLIADSVQMIHQGGLTAAPGSVAQLRACCQELVALAKTTGTALLLVGHVTKEGRLAGPRLLEHMVDAVLYFEGDRYHHHRVVRGIKNRYGATLEVGLFEMTDRGLREAAEGAGLPAAEHRAAAGSVVCPTLQGSRCLLVELQALTATGFLGSAKRKASGIDATRLAMLIAVLEKRGGLRLADQDVFASSVGGMRVVEPATDLALALAVAGAHYDRTLAQGWCALGEIGLGGEIRHVQQVDQRVREAARLGFTRILCPASSAKAPADAEVVPVATLDQALRMLT